MSKFDKKVKGAKCYAVLTRQITDSKGNVKKSFYDIYKMIG